MKFLHFFMMGFFVNSITTRLSGVRSMDDIYFPIILLALTIVSAVLDYKRNPNEY